MRKQKLDKLVFEEQQNTSKMIQIGFILLGFIVTLIAGAIWAYIKIL